MFFTRACSALLLFWFATLQPSIAGEQPANQWTHIQQLPGGTACAARLAGSEVDTMLMLDNVGQLILVAGRSDWQISGPQKVTLKIDRFQLVQPEAGAFGNLVLLSVTDKSVVERLKVAKSLYWTLPFGKYHAVVSGLGNALTWVRQCEQGKRQGTK